MTIVHSVGVQANVSTVFPIGWNKDMINFFHNYDDIPISNHKNNKNSQESASNLFYYKNWVLLLEFLHWMGGCKQSSVLHVLDVFFIRNSMLQTVSTSVGNANDMLETCLKCWKIDKKTIISWFKLQIPVAPIGLHTNICIEAMQNFPIIFWREKSSFRLFVCECKYDGNDNKWIYCYFCFLNFMKLIIASFNSTGLDSIHLA